MKITPTFGAAFLALIASASSATVTQPASNTTRVALLGCIDEERPVPALKRYVELDADLHLWLGDNVYVDTQSDIDAFYEAYDLLSEKPYFTELRGQGVHLATWDDHDFGDNNETSSYPLKRESLGAFTAFWGNSEALADPSDGIYQQHILDFDGKTLNVILLDVRFNRDQPDGNGDILGEKQWQWLEQAIAADADLTLLVSGTQFLLSSNADSETWENYPLSLARLKDLVRLSNPPPVVMISGDQHYAEANVRKQWFDVDAVELQFAGVNQIEEPELNYYRASPVNTSLNTVGYLDIQWEPSEQHLPHILYTVEDAMSGEVEFTYRINLGDLVPEPELSGIPVFDDEAVLKLTSPYPALSVQYQLIGATGQRSQWEQVNDGVVRVTREGVLRTALFSSSGVQRGRFVEQPVTRMSLEGGVKTRPLSAGLHVFYEEGDYDLVPPASAVTSYLGTVNEPTVDGLTTREDKYALWFKGFVTVPESGIYRVTSFSDDGSLVYLHGDLVVDNDGSHSPTPAGGLVGLKAGTHPLAIGYFENYAGETLTLRWALKTSEQWRPINVRYSHNPDESAMHQQAGQQ